MNPIDEIKTHLHNNEFQEAEAQCEEALEQQPEQINVYWYWGLSLLYQKREEEAHLAWMSPLLEADEEQAEQWSHELATVLHSQATERENNGEWEWAWLLRRHLREIDPNNVNNVLQLLDLELQTQQFSLESELWTEIIAILQQGEVTLKAESQLLLNIIRKLLQLDVNPSTVAPFIENSLPYFNEYDPLLQLLTAKADRCYRSTRLKFAAEWAKLCLQIAPDNLDILFKVVPLLLSSAKEDHPEGIRQAKKCFHNARNLAEKIDACHSILSGLTGAGGRWAEAVEFYQIYKSLLVHLPEASEKELPTNVGFKLIIEGVFFYYFEDNPQETRPIRNAVADLFQTRVQNYYKEQVEKYQRSHQENRHRLSKTRRLKIGYLSQALRLNSVGWLVRWILKYHDREQFEIHLYSYRYSDDSIQASFAHQFGENFHEMSSFSRLDVAEKIHQDEIDILVELDSLTMFSGCFVTALKPAPIQINWLGSDASGLPAIDYFIADPYVLPETAQDYYQEKIWRLPNNYIGVDGFEAHTPSLRREDLDIPEDAVVYLSAQTGLKRNPDNVRLQMKILHAVPHSYFLIKTIAGHDESIETFFYQIAEEEGVSREQLRFLSSVPTSQIHRANLTLADVVLDTYPYNGATTTLETLWMEVPLVTKVGTQFTARNSYTMLRNVGVTEGLAWSDEEYIDWGVRLGKEEALRKEVQYKLRKSKHTSPLWNGKQFARDMETAYQQMWEKYVEDVKTYPVAEEATAPQTEKPKLRLLHNLPRCGGTLISKCLATMENNLLLSEIHPQGVERFNPFQQAHQWFNLLSDDDLSQYEGKSVSFVDVIRLIQQRSEERNSSLIIRDWAHLDFFGVPWINDPSYHLDLAETLKTHFDLIQVAIVRHPIDQWLSLRRLEIIQGKLSVEEFLKGYLEFAKIANEIGFIRYEDFTQNPDATLQDLCQKLDLSFDPEYRSKWSGYTKITGDTITNRTNSANFEFNFYTNKQLDQELLEQLAHSQYYQEIIQLTQYSTPVAISNQWLVKK